MDDFLKPIFIDLRYDFAFKSIFGSQGNEDLLLKLINAILPEKHFTSVSLMNNEQMGLRKESRRAVFDVFATTSDGSDFTIEMQLNDQADFNQRMVFYSSFPVQNLVKKGNGKPGEPELYYTFPHVYVIGITDFIMSGVPDTKDMINSYSIRNEKHLSNPLTDKVTYVTVELPKLTKSLAELSTPEDFLFYAIKNIGTMKAMPKEFKGKGLDKLFDLCRFASMTEAQQRKYIAEMMAKFDEGSRIATAIEKGKKEGKAEGKAEGESNAKAEVAKNLLEMGMPAETVSKATGLSAEEIAAL